MKNCCFNCFKAGCLHYCGSLITLNSVADVSGEWKLEMYWGENYVAEVVTQLNAGEQIAFSLGTINLSMVTNLVIVAPDGTRKRLVDDDSDEYDCIEISSINSPSSASLLVPLSIML